MKNLGRMALGVAAAVVLTELVLSAFRPFNLNFYQYDPEVYTSHVPGAVGHFQDEGDAWIKINSQGMNDREHTFQKSPGVYRIALLGDSMLEALQVPREQTFASLLERDLSGCARFKGKTIETLNFGVGGYGNVEELLTLRSKVWQYQPDLIVLLFTTANDMEDNLRPLYKKILEPEQYHPLSKAEVFVRRTLETVASKFYTGQLLLVASKRFKAIFLPRNGATQILHAENHLRTMAGLRYEPYLPPRDEQWNRAWTVTEKILGLFANETKEHKTPFLLVTATSSHQVDPDPKTRELVKQSLGTNDLFYPDERITQIGKKFGFPVLNLAPKFQEYAEKHGIYFHGFTNIDLGKGHWNAFGHHLASLTTSEAICAGTGR